jgi:hypothetical protein
MLTFFCSIIMIHPTSFLVTFFHGVDLGVGFA